MKKWVIAAAVLAAVLLLAPSGFGRIAEKRVNAGLDKLVEQAPYLVIAGREWNAGWFRSSQTVTFELAEGFRGLMDEAAMAQAMAEAADEEEDAAGPAAPRPSVIPERFVVRNDVLHGPVPGFSGIGVARLESTLELPEETRAKIREVFGPEPALSIRTRLGLFGGATTVLESKGRTLQLARGAEGEITYGDFRLVARYDGDFDRYSVDSGVPRISVKGTDGGSAELTRLVIEGEGHRVQGDLYDGEASLRLGELKVLDATAREFTVADAHYIATVRTDDGFSRMGFQMGAGEVESADVAAMGLQIEEAHYDFSLRRLHTDTLEKIFAEFRQFYARPAGSDAAALALNGELFEPIKAHAGALLAHDPEFGVDRVGVLTADGEFVIRGVVKLVGFTPGDLSLSGLPALIGKVQAEFTVEAAQPLLEKMPNGAMMSGMALDLGYATREGGKLVSRIELRDGRLTINGKATPLPGLGGGAPPGATPLPESAAPAAVEM